MPQIFDPSGVSVGDQRQALVTTSSVPIKASEGAREMSLKKMAASRKQTRTYDAHVKQPILLLGAHHVNVYVAA